MVDSNLGPGIEIEAQQTTKQKKVIPSGDMALNKYFFALSPPKDLLKIKSSVVIRLPVYNDYSISSNETGVDFGDPSKNGQPLTFESLYRSYTPDNVAQLLVAGGIISKSIRYGLLYNYFGIPAANLSTGYWEDDSDSQYTAFRQEVTRKRVVSYASPIDAIGGTWGVDVLDPSTFFTEYAQGLYQYGRLGQIAPFEGTPGE